MGAPRRKLVKDNRNRCFGLPRQESQEPEQQQQDVCLGCVVSCTERNKVPGGEEQDVDEVSLRSLFHYKVKFTACTARCCALDPLSLDSVAGGRGPPRLPKLFYYVAFSFNTFLERLRHVSSYSSSVLLPGNNYYPCGLLAPSACHMPSTPAAALKLQYFDSLPSGTPQFRGCDAPLLRFTSPKAHFYHLMSHLRYF